MPLLDDSINNLQDGAKLTLTPREGIVSQVPTEALVGVTDPLVRVSQSAAEIHLKAKGSGYQPRFSGHNLYRSLFSIFGRL